MASFTVCSYNMKDTFYPAGQSSEGFCRLQVYTEDSRSDDKVFEAAKQKTAELLKGKAHVYCLQEVGQNNPLLQELEKERFTIIRAGSNVIALDSTRFSSHTDCSERGKHIGFGGIHDTAIALAVDQETKKEVAFASTGVGFARANNGGKIFLSPDNGGTQIASELSALGTLNLGALQVIGAGVSANPIMADTLLEHLSAGDFETHRLDTHTMVDPLYSNNHDKVEADFIFTKTPPATFWQRIKAIFVSTFYGHVSIKEIQPLGFDPTRNASNHIPLFIEVKTRESKISQLWNRLSASISSCFRASPPQYALVETEVSTL